MISVLKRPRFVALRVLPAHRVVIAVIVVAFGTREVIRRADPNEGIQGVNTSSANTQIPTHHLIALRNAFWTNVLDSMVHLKDVLAVTATVAGDAFRKVLVDLHARLFGRIKVVAKVCLWGHQKKRI